MFTTVRNRNGKKSNPWHSLPSFKPPRFIPQAWVHKLNLQMKLTLLGLHIFKLSSHWSEYVLLSRSKKKKNEMWVGYSSLSWIYNWLKNHTQEMVKELTDIWKKISRKKIGIAPVSSDVQISLDQGTLPTWSKTWLKSPFQQCCRKLWPTDQV